jgi:uncharacterized membrane protein YhhN
MRTPQKVVLALFAGAAAINVIASGTGNDVADAITKPMLMPLLALLVWLAVPAPRDRKLFIAGQLAAAAGDIALIFDGTVAFLIGMVLFLGCHVCYIVTFARAGAFGRLRARPLVPVAYAVVFAGALAWLWGGLGGLRVPIAVYALALTTMAAASATFGARIGLGGALFMLSDMLIAVDIAHPDAIGGPPIWVMLTYVAGQGLLATGWLKIISDQLPSSETKLQTVTLPA